MSTSVSDISNLCIFNLVEEGEEKVRDWHKRHAELLRYVQDVEVVTKQLQKTLGLDNTGEIDELVSSNHPVEHDIGIMEARLAVAGQAWARYIAATGQLCSTYQLLQAAQMAQDAGRKMHDEPK